MAEEELIAFEDTDQAAAEEEAAADGGGSTVTYAGVRIAGFRDFLLKPELQRAIVEAGFEHPSEVQHQTLPDAMLGRDILCQAKSGMGKTAVFVLSVLHRLDGKEKKPACIVIAHTKELTFQIYGEFVRFARHFSTLSAPGKIMKTYGGQAIANDVKSLQECNPVIIISTPGRMKDLVVDRKALDVSALKFFILDEADNMLENLNMRGDIQEIFKKTPQKKQVMMFSATMPVDVRATAKKFMRDPQEIFVDSEKKLTLHGLKQYYVTLDENEKVEKLHKLLEELTYNQCVIFVKSIQRAKQLNMVLEKLNLKPTMIHGGMQTQERIDAYDAFKKSRTRIMVTTDVLARGVDVEKINVVINFDMTEEKAANKPTDTYLHRVGRAGRFGTKGLAITFVSSDEDAATLSEVQRRFEIGISELPEKLDASSYLTHVPQEK